MCPYSFFLKLLCSNSLRCNLQRLKKSFSTKQFAFPVTSRQTPKRRNERQLDLEQRPSEGGSRQVRGRQHRLRNLEQAEVEGDVRP